jgi:hypothetical protein
MAESPLNWSVLDSLDHRAFQRAEPYPWINPHGALLPEAFEELAATLPELSLFQPSFGVERKYGQKPHDRYTLEYSPEIQLSPAWRGFMDELCGARYRAWLRRMLGTPFFTLSFHWHYAPNGASVSPHCDSKMKLGSHIFYMNTKRDWCEEWGGQTLVLDDGGRFAKDSAPAFEDFERQICATTVENYSLLFRRRGDSWHGVREIRCPEDRMRKVLIVVINSSTPWRRLKNWVRGKPQRGM